MKNILLYGFVPVLSLCWLVTLSCLPLRPLKYYKLNPRYKYEVFHDKALSIMVVPRSCITINNPDDVKDDFKTEQGAPVAVVQKVMYRMMNRVCRQYIKNVCYTEIKPPYGKLENVYDGAVCCTLGTEADTAIYKIAPREYLDENGVGADFILFINSVDITRNKISTLEHVASVGSPTVAAPKMPLGSVGPVSVGVGGADKVKGINAEFRYILWDYNADEYVTYGKKTITATYRFALTDDTWNTLFADIPLNIFSHTPFSFMYEEEMHD